MIAPAELSDKLLAKRILGIVSETGFDPRRLVIEIAETAMEANAAHAAATLDELREAGVKIVLDDFGAGFSSLPELATLQLDGIKIDRSLFANLSDASANEKLVQAVIAFGHGDVFNDTANTERLLSGRFHTAREVRCHPALNASWSSSKC